MNYKQGIYDGEDMIASFDMNTMDDPMQALMVFSAIQRPILLRHLKLTPGGKPLVSGVQLYWKGGGVVTDVLDGLSVEGSGTDRLIVTFKTRDRDNILSVTRTLTLTYDPDIGYVYDFSDSAIVLDNNKLGSTPVNFEYCDPWLESSPAPSRHFPGAWKGRYRQFAYEAMDGTIKSVPHQHYGNSQKGGIRVKQDGIFAAVYESDGNPGLRPMADAEKLRISICP